MESTFEASSESGASSEDESGSAFDGSDASDDDEDMSGGDESGDDWEELEQKALKCKFLALPLDRGLILS